MLVNYRPLFLILLIQCDISTDIDKHFNEIEALGTNLVPSILTR
jgi:hypothetical protein